MYMSSSRANRSDELRAEQQLLLKADADIEQGWRRIRAQEARVRALEADGHDTAPALRLADVFKQTVAEWERHRILIDQRIIYLRSQIGSAPMGAE